MPRFTVPDGDPLHEANDCHSPAGSSVGGQFCAAPGETPKRPSLGDRLARKAAGMRRQRLAGGGAAAEDQRRRDFQMARGRATQKTIRAIRDREETEQWLADIDRLGSKTVQVGTEGGKKFGYKQLAKLQKLVAAGVLERVDVPGGRGVTPIMSRAKHLLNKTRGYSVEHVFRRKR